MALLYLLEDRVAVDEEGTKWLLNEDGAWQRGAPRPTPHLRLVTSRPTDAEEISPRSVAGADTVLAMSAWVGADAVPAAR